MSSTSPEGQTLVISILYHGSTFSLLNLVSDNRTPYNFTTVLATEVRKVPQAELVTFLQTHSDVMYEFHLRFLSGILGLTHRLEQSTFVSAYCQVAGVLLYFAKHFSPTPQESNQRLIEIKITHQEIAEWLGLSRENVSLQMKQLERDGFIQKSGKFIEIIDIEKMSVIASGNMVEGKYP